MRTDEQGVPLWKMPGDNIDYGMGLLAQYIQECGGDEDAGVAAYNAGPGKVRRVLRLLRPNATPKERRAALNSVTTHKKYVTYVYSRLDEWRSLRKEAEDGAHKAIV
jgi:soluble lytic murein transglycosylase-like protein